MGKPYAKPPLVEAVAEFRFNAAQPWDWTLPGLIYARVRDQYPQKRQVSALEVTLKSQPEALLHSFKGSADRMQFVSQDSASLIQVGPDLLSVNQLRPYSSWDRFRSDILRALSVYREIAQPRSLKRLGLRYINRIEVPGNEVRIEDFLVPTPNLPKEIPEDWTSFLTRVQAVYPDQDRVLMFMIGMTPPEERANAYILDLDLGTAEGKAPDLDHAEDWINRAHQDLELIFESSVTDKARALFGGRP